MLRKIAKMFGIKKIVKGYVIHDEAEAARLINKLDAMGLDYYVTFNKAYEYWRIEVVNKD